MIDRNHPFPALVFLVGLAVIGFLSLDDAIRGLIELFSSPPPSRNGSSPATGTVTTNRGDVNNAA